jgi:hypothetical protein
MNFKYEIFVSIKKVEDYVEGSTFIKSFDQLKLHAYAKKYLFLHPAH